MFPIEKYKYFTNGKTIVIAEQTFAGKKYRGKATLSGDDVFDFEKGKLIAAAKCNIKICLARESYAKKRLKEAERVEKAALDEMLRMDEYSYDAHEDVLAAQEYLRKLTS